MSSIIIGCNKGTNVALLNETLHVNGQAVATITSTGVITELRYYSKRAALNCVIIDDEGKKLPPGDKPLPISSGYGIYVDTSRKQLTLRVIFVMRMAS